MSLGLHLVTAALLAVSLIVLARSPTRTGPGSRPDELSEFYKTKCSECHGDKAELKFDENLTEADMINVILKGKLVDNPPDMPAFEEKGVTKQQAKALADLMKKLKKS
jgi:mono/diheme cytochrome c family protein